jgi:hypothetical protein
MTQTVSLKSRADSNYERARRSFFHLGRAGASGYRSNRSPEGRVTRFAMLGWLGHLPCSYSEQDRRAPETNRPSVSGRSSWPQNGPRKTNAHEEVFQVRVIIGCGGRIRTALSGGVWGGDRGGDCCVADRRTQCNLGTRCQTRRHPLLKLAAGGANGKSGWLEPFYRPCSCTFPPRTTPIANTGMTFQAKKWDTWRGPRVCFKIS